MRNPSKNTIKRLMRGSKELKVKGIIHPQWDSMYQAHLFYDVAQQLVKMSKGKINNMSITGIEKYT